MLQLDSILTAEIDISTPLDVFDTNGSDLNDEKCEDPVRCRSESSRSATDGQGCILRRNYNETVRNFALRVDQQAGLRT